MNELQPITHELMHTLDAYERQKALEVYWAWQDRQRKQERLEQRRIKAKIQRRRIAYLYNLTKITINGVRYHVDVFDGELRENFY